MRILEIAVIEDNRADLEWLKIILDEVDLKHRLTVATDGEQAVQCLLRQGHYAGNPPADLIFLDMHLPKFDALDVLRKVPDSAQLPVCLLTSSDLEQELISRHFGKPTAYLIKPLSAEKLICCLRSHEDLRPIADTIARP
jgi:CheY-like chemotaxis protein